MRVYVSSHCVEKARDVAAACEAAGHSVVSTWHLGAGPLASRADLTPDQLRDKAKANLAQVAIADALVLVGGAERYPGGKFVEAGFALGRGRPVVVWGRRENILMHHPKVVAFDAMADAVNAVSEV